MTDNKQTKQGELIPGMNDIMNHIKKLEKENKELKEKSKEWEDLYEKEALQNGMDYVNNGDGKIEDLEEEMEQMETKIKELEKENKELKEANKMLNNYNEANIKLRQEKEDEIEQNQKWFEEKNGNGISVAIKELNEEVEQNQKWFEEINELIGAKSEDPSVVAVEEYVKQMKIVDNELSKARKYERFLEYKLEQENIDYLIPDNYEERDYDGSSEEEDD